MSQSKTRRTLDDIIRFTSSVGESSTFIGSIDTTDNVIVRGTVIGDSKIDGIVVIESSGKWLGNIRGHTFVIKGQVEGDITALYKIEIQKSAQLIGNIYSPRIAIERGAIHDGHVNMEHKPQITTFKEKRSKNNSTTEVKSYKK